MADKTRIAGKQEIKPGDKLKGKPIADAVIANRKPLPRKPLPKPKKAKR